MKTYTVIRYDGGYLVSLDAECFRKLNICSIHWTTTVQTDRLLDHEQVYLLALKKRKQ